MLKEKLTCRTHCIYWNSIDQDCELYGENHLRPTNCISFWLQKIKVGRIFKQENGEVFVISNSSGIDYSVIYKDGYATTYKTTDDNLKFVLHEQIAEYPNWKDAICSKEFNDVAED